MGFVAGAGQCVGERFGIAVQLGVERLQAFEFVFQREPLFGFFFVGVLHEFAEFAHALVERGEQAVDAFVVVFGEAFAFLFENVVGKVLKLVGQALAHFGELRQLLLVGVFGFVELGLQTLVLDLQRGFVFLQGAVIVFQTGIFVFAAV